MGVSDFPDCSACCKFWSRFLHLKAFSWQSSKCAPHKNFIGQISKFSSIEHTGTQNYDICCALSTSVVAIAAFKTYL